MNTEAQTRLAEARAMLAEATSLNDSGQHGAALKQAYHASEHVAVAYLAAVIGQSLPPSDSGYDLFAETIRVPSLHPEFLQEIREVVGDVCTLREAYHPALLEETLPADTQEMIDRVAALLELVEQITENC